MVNTGKRVQKKKSIRTPSKTTTHYSRKKSKKISCAITGKKLAGTHKDKKSKTQKRPTAPFGGILSGKAREEVFIEVGKVMAGIKKINDVDQKYRKYVKQIIK